MNPQFTTNNNFEELLTAEWSFDIMDNFVDDSLFTNISGNIYEYKYIVTHLTSVKNIKKITDIKYDLFENVVPFDIGIRFRYSDNMNFGTFQNVTDNNLKNISGNKYFQIEITWTIDKDSDEYVDMINSQNHNQNLCCNCGPDRSTFIDINIPANHYILPISNLYIIGEREIDPIFNAAVIPGGEMRVFTAEDTYKVFSTDDYKLYLKSGLDTCLKIYFRYTNNQGRNWTEWLELTKGNLQRQQYTKIKFTDFQFGFHNVCNTPVELYDMELIGDFQNVTGNYKKLGRYGLKTQCNPTLNDDDDGAGNCCGGNSDNPFDGYDKVKDKPSKYNCKPCSSSKTPWQDDYTELDIDTSNVDNLNDKALFYEQIKLQEQLNQYAEAKNHWRFEYFYTDPDEKGIDVVLHENQLINVFLQKELKVVVPNNEFPSDQVNFSQWGMDLVIQFEVHILRSSFKKLFGVESRPRRGDYMYLCDTNLIYEVEQVLDKRDIMNSSFYWRVILKKYEEKASRKFAKTDDGQNAKTLTDSIVKYTNLATLFSDENAIQTNKNNTDVNNATGNISGNDTNRDGQGTDRVDGIYNLHKTFDDKLKYSNTKIWNASVIVSENQYMIPFTKKGENRMVTYNYTDNIKDTDNRAITFWFKSNKYDPTYSYDVFSNYDGNNNIGIRASIFQGKLDVEINGDMFSLPITLQSDYWYAFYISVDNSRKKLELAVYKRQSENGKYLTNNTLIKLHGHVWDINTYTFDHKEDMFIGSMSTFHDITTEYKNQYFFITNIVLWNEPIEKSKRSLVLNQEKIKDSHLVIFADDAKENINLPFYGNL